MDRAHQSGSPKRNMMAMGKNMYSPNLNTSTVTGVSLHPSRSPFHDSQFAPPIVNVTPLDSLTLFR